MKLVRFIASLLMMITLLNGCATTPQANYYLLTPTVAPQSDRKSEHSINIGVGPIEFPSYLNRNQIVTRSGDNTLQLAEYHRWAEPLESNFAQVLTQNLAAELPDADVYTFPWFSDAAIDLQIYLKVMNFDSDNRNRSRLVVLWELADRNKDVRRTPQNRVYTVAAQSDDYAALVAALSQCVTELSRDLAAAVNASDTR